MACRGNQAQMCGAVERLTIYASMKKNVNSGIWPWDDNTDGDSDDEAQEDRRFQGLTDRAS
jgi:hypothetical protein